VAYCTALLASSAHVCVVAVRLRKCRESAARLRRRGQQSAG
jgi:hypothetical protein